MLAMATLKSIRGLQKENFYCPLLDASNPDNCGQYAYVWQNSIYQGKRIRSTWTKLDTSVCRHCSTLSCINNDAQHTSRSWIQKETYWQWLCHYCLQWKWLCLRYEDVESEWFVRFLGQTKINLICRLEYVNMPLKCVHRAVQRIRAFD